MNMTILNNSVQENVNASRVVKAFVREDYEIENSMEFPDMFIICLLKQRKSLHGTHRL